MLDRRRLMAGAACGLALGVLALRSARAFTIEDKDAKGQELYQAACSARENHDQLANDAAAALASRQAELLAKFDINEQGVACPICGCRVGLGAKQPAKAGAK